MKTNFSLLVSAFVGSSALLVSTFAQTAGSGAGSGASSTSSTTSTTASGLPTATTPTTVTTGLPAASTTTLPAATTTTLPAATTTQLSTTSTGVLPATESALPTSINDTSANRATVSSDARVLNSTIGTTTANGSTTGMTTTTTTGGTQVSVGTTPLGPTDVGQFPISGTSNTVRGAADATATTATATVSLPNAATRPGEAPITANAVTRIAVATPPPAPQRETMPPSPGADQSWIPGHYAYVQGQWIWLSGRWTTPPTNGARWIEGTYDPATRLFTEGHWDLSASALANPVR